MITQSPRIQYPGAWYHVMNQGMQQQCLFVDNEMREGFLSLVNELDKKYKIQCHAYCLMDNHYHLLLYTPLANLDKGIQHLHSSYTQYFNHKQGIDEMLFSDDYYSLLVEAGTYLLQVSRFIHRNPFDVGRVKQLSEYPWSSYPYYVDGRKTLECLYREDVLGQLDENNQGYRQYVEEDNEETAVEKIFKTKQHEPILGSNAFIKDITDRFQVESMEMLSLSQMHGM